MRSDCPKSFELEEGIFDLIYQPCVNELSNIAFCSVTLQLEVNLRFVVKEPIVSGRIM